MFPALFLPVTVVHPGSGGEPSDSAPVARCQHALENRGKAGDWRRVHAALTEQEDEDRLIESLEADAAAWISRALQRTPVKMRVVVRCQGDGGMKTVRCFSEAVANQVRCNLRWLGGQGIARGLFADDGFEVGSEFIELGRALEREVEGTGMRWYLSGRAWIRVERLLARFTFLVFLRERAIASIESRGRGSEEWQRQDVEAREALRVGFNLNDVQLARLCQWSERKTFIVVRRCTASARKALERFVEGQAAQAARECLERVGWDRVETAVRGWLWEQRSKAELFLR